MFSSALLLAIACHSPEPAPGSAQAVADAFVDAYFVHADQRAARRYAAFTAAAMLDRELSEVRAVRSRGHDPAASGLAVQAERGARSRRGERVRFDFVLSFPAASGRATRHADVELARVEGAWRVVRVGLLAPLGAPDGAARP